jgi:hypothetical protein
MSEITAGLEPVDVPVAEPEPMSESTAGLELVDVPVAEPEPLDDEVEAEPEPDDVLVDESPAEMVIAAVVVPVTPAQSVTVSVSWYEPGDE